MEKCHSTFSLSSLIEIMNLNPKFIKQMEEYID